MYLFFNLLMLVRFLVLDLPVWSLLALPVSTWVLHVPSTVQKPVRPPGNFIGVCAGVCVRMNYFFLCDALQWNLKLSKLSKLSRCSHSVTPVTILSAGPSGDRKWMN